MGLRFQKRIKILPGIGINLSKSGISTSLGVKGAHVTLGHGKTRTTLGVPGTGISHTTVKSTSTLPQKKNAIAPLQSSDEAGHTIPTLAVKAGRLLYKAVGWAFGFILFLLVLSLVIQYFAK